MADWTTIANNEIDGDSPITESLMTALRDNPVAITQGASGAPKIQNAALDADVVTTSKILNNAVTSLKILDGSVTASKLSSSLYTAGAIGTYALLKGPYATSISVGTTYAGSSLTYSGFAFAIDGSSVTGRYSGTASGTWRAMGYGIVGSLDYVTTLFLRIA
jgi:hypothetical protein